jgi:hypothetical protein
MTTNCTCIYFNEQTTIMMNEFSSTMGQILAASLSSLVLLPMYNYYNYKFKVKSE